MSTPEPFPRRIWRTLEPYHAITYFAPETRAATDALGLKGGWMSYFGCRAAPLGPVGPVLVTALFYSFHPLMVARSLPDAWSYAEPSQLLDARLTAVDAAVRRLLPDAIGSADLARAAELARRAVELTVVDGRPMAAANSALPWPDDPHLALWQATTTLREARGDGHVAALVASGLSSCQACVTISAAGGPPPEVFKVSRRWSDEEWAAASADLALRGYMHEDGTLTSDGVSLREDVERRTDELADQTWQALGEDDSAELDRLVRPLSRVLMANGSVPAMNPIGLRWDPAEINPG
ncbi:MAG: SCO6745 family protein [Kribbellaceae bacterium]